MSKLWRKVLEANTASAATSLEELCDLDLSVVSQKEDALDKVCEVLAGQQQVIDILVVEACKKDID